MSKRPDYLPRYPEGGIIPSHVNRHNRLAPEREARAKEGGPLVRKLLERFQPEELARKCGCSRAHILHIAEDNKTASAVTLKILRGLA